MQINGREYSQRELLRRVGNVSQVGGVRLLQHEEGHARGTREIEFRTGSGLRFTVGPDRGFDVAFAEFRGIGLCWLPRKGLAGPWYYEGDLDDHAWLRVGLGGLFNTAGLVSMGTPQTVKTRAVRVHAAAGRPLRDARPHRGHARKPLHARRGVGAATAACSWPRASCARRSRTARTCRSTRRYETELGATSFRIHRHGRERGLVRRRRTSCSTT